MAAFTTQLGVEEAMAASALFGVDEGHTSSDEGYELEGEEDELPFCDLIEHIRKRFEEVKTGRGAHTPLRRT